MLQWGVRGMLFLIAAIAAGAAASCSKASDSGQAHNWQQEAPPREVEIPAQLSIDVLVDGAPKPAITTAMLSTKTPDYADSERRAWRIAGLEPEAAQPGAVVEAASPAGVAVKYPHADGTEPCLYLTRRGEVAVASLDPKDPFPKYHGQGSRLHRPGDQLPHVTPVAKLTITTR